MWENMENIKKEKEKKKFLEQFIVCIIKNYKGAEFFLHSEGNRIRILLVRSRRGVVRAFYHIDFKDLTISTDRKLGIII